MNQRTFILTLLFISTVFFPHAFAQDYMRWELPEGAKMRLGKGQIENFEGHLTDIGRARSYQFSPDSNQLAVISSIGIWLYDVQTGRELTLTTAARMNGMSNDIALNPDWQTFAKRDSDENTVELWDLHTGQLKTTFEGHKKRIAAVAFSPDSKLLASGDFDGMIWLWNIDTNEHKQIQTSHKIVDEVMFSPDGRTIVSSWDRDTRLWDIATGEFKGRLEDTTGTNNIVFNSDGTILYGASRNELRLWDPDTGKITMKLGFKSSQARHSVFSPDGQTIATGGGNDYTVQLWDSETGRLKNALVGDPKYIKMIMISDDVPKLVDYATKRVESIAFSPDGRTLAVSSHNEIVFWDPNTGEQKAVLTGKGSFYNLLFSPDGRTLAAKGESGIYLWRMDTTDIQKSELRHTITGYNWEVNSIAFNPNGQSLASGYRRKNIKLWDASTGQLRKVFKGHRYPLWVQSIAFSPNGDTLASLSLSRQSSDHKAEILLWDTATGEYQVTLKGHGKVPDNRIPNQSGIAFSPNGEILASGSGDGTIRLWNAKAAVSNSFFYRLWRTFFRHYKATLKGHTYHVLSVAFSPDGQTIASGSLDKTVRLWDVRRRKLKATLTEHEIDVRSVAFSPDGQTLVSGDENGTIYLWDPITADRITSLVVNPRARAAVNSLVFSPDGSILASGGSTLLPDGGWSGAIFLWDMSTHQLKTTFIGHKSSVNTVDFSPDGKTLASGGGDGTVLIWELEP